MTLKIQPELLAVVRLEPTASIPSWATQTPFFAITRTADELSVVCTDQNVPEAGLKCERPWRALKVQGPLDFSLTGILASLASALAKAGVPIFAISTFDTDYILVKADNLEAAVGCLELEGHTIVD